jgi:predicted ATPase
MSSLPFSAFTADGFRGLRSLEVSELRGINVFVGGNNSGKTSVLETVALLSNPASGNEWMHMIRRRDHGRLDESMVTSLRWCFSEAHRLSVSGADTDTPAALQCQLSAQGAHPIRAMTCRYGEHVAPPNPTDSDLLLRMGVDPASTSVRHGVLVSELTWDSAIAAPAGEMRSALQEPPRQSSVMVNDLSPIPPGTISHGVTQTNRFACPYAALLPYSYQLNTLQVGARSSQLFLDDKSLLLELMHQFDDDIQDVEIASFSGWRPAIYIKHRRLGVVPLSAFGDAMRRCLLLATTLTNLGKGGVLLLDEIEVGIHIDSLPKVLKWLVDAARQIGVQVFATTHSLEVLDALLAAEVGEEDLAAYRIKQGDERTECQRFAFDSLKRLRYERGLDIR